MPAKAGCVALRPSKGFTIVEVMIAAVILTIGFMGMISAMTTTSGMMDHARRQTVANQILNNEIEDMRLLSWDVSGSTNDIVGVSTSSTAVAIDREFWPTWSSTATYAANHVVSYNGAWYRCIAANTNQTPPNATYWTSVTTGATTDIVKIHDAIYTLSMVATNPDAATYIREIKFTVTWVVTTSRRDTNGNLLTFTYTRAGAAWYGKYGLNLSYQRT